MYGSSAISYNATLTDRDGQTATFGYRAARVLGPQRLNLGTYVSMTGPQWRFLGGYPFSSGRTARDRWTTRITPRSAAQLLLDCRLRGCGACLACPVHDWGPARFEFIADFAHCIHAGSGWKRLKKVLLAKTVFSAQKDGVIFGRRFDTGGPTRSNVTEFHMGKSFYEDDALSLRAVARPRKH